MNWQQEFKNPNLLREAFIHRSYLNEHPEIKSSHNERLEFLGDAVLELVTTEYLYIKYPNANEGELTAYRAALVNTETLSNVARETGMNDYLLLSRGELRDTGRARSVILANTFEAVLGAIFLDRGYIAVQGFLAHYLFPKTDKIVKEALWQDAKSLFQEKAQAISGVTPDYRVLGEVGPDHDKIFTVGLYLNQEQVSTGTGPSKQRAEQEAARLGLIIKEWNN